MHEDVNLDIGHRIRARRLLLEKSQEALATQLGISPQQVHKYETGQSAITAGRLSDVARALDCEIGYFFEQFGQGPSLPAELIRLLSQPRVLRVLRNYAQLSPALRLSILDLLETLNREQGNAEDMPDLLSLKRGSNDA